MNETLDIIESDPDINIPYEQDEHIRSIYQYRDIGTRWRDQRHNYWHLSYKAQLRQNKKYSDRESVTTTHVDDKKECFISIICRNIRLLQFRARAEQQLPLFSDQKSLLYEETSESVFAPSADDAVQMTAQIDKEYSRC